LAANEGSFKYGCKRGKGGRKGPNKHHEKGKNDVSENPMDGKKSR